MTVNAITDTKKGRTGIAPTYLHTTQSYNTTTGFELTTYAIKPEHLAHWAMGAPGAVGDSGLMVQYKLADVRYTPSTTFVPLRLVCRHHLSSLRQRHRYRRSASAPRARH